VSVYRFAWGLGAALATGWAAASVLAAGTWFGVLAVSLLLASGGGLLAHTFCEDRPDQWRWTVRATLWTWAGAAVCGGLTSAWPRGGALLALVLVLTCPFVLGWARVLMLRAMMRSSNGPLEALGRRQLLRRWQWTTIEVQRSTTPLERRLALVEQRRMMLDELERRDPLHFDDWVVSAVPDRAPSVRRHQT
jgi:hypothetical protein